MPAESTPIPRRAGRSPSAGRRVDQADADAGDDEAGDEVRPVRARGKPGQRVTMTVAWCPAAFLSLTSPVSSSQHAGAYSVNVGACGYSCNTDDDVTAPGAADSYLRSYAAAVAAFGFPVILSFGHEMNGNWYSWGDGHTAPATFVAAWRHIVQVFRAEKAANVTWLWAGHHLEPK
jgi:hypothetical protein